jgi:transcriptional regulator with XRE-family HTH domain
VSKLAYWRGRRRLTMRELAVKSGVGVATISRLESGHIKSHLTTLDKLACALEIDLTELAELAKGAKLGSTQRGQLKQQKDWNERPD